MTGIGEIDALARAAVVADWPEPGDVDAWPDIDDLPGRLLPVLEALRLEVRLAGAKGLPPGSALLHSQAVEAAREAIITLQRLSPLYRWRMLHPPRPDGLDGLVDCGNPDCPRVGFRDAKDRDLHLTRWGMK